MRMKKWAVAPALAVIVGLSLTPPASAAPVWGEDTEGGERYVSMGDSFVSGPGITNQSGADCARSDRNFPTLIATELEAEAFDDASCSGAETENYWNPQGANPPQLDSLDEDTTLVTLGMMGGNDVNLVGLATQCVVADCVGDEEAMQAEIDALRPIYSDMIDDARERAPHATLVAVGYGTYVPPESCPALVGVTPEEAQYLQRQIDYLSDTIGAVAAENGVPFADLREIPDSLEHTPCASTEEQWIRGLSTPPGDGSLFHPSSLGMSVYADHIMETIREARTPDVSIAAGDDNSGVVTAGDMLSPEISDGAPATCTLWGPFDGAPSEIDPANAPEVATAQVQLTGDGQFDCDVTAPDDPGTYAYTVATEEVLNPLVVGVSSTAVSDAAVFVVEDEPEETTPLPPSADDDAGTAPAGYLVHTGAEVQPAPAPIAFWILLAAAVVAAGFTVRTVRR